MMTSKGLWPAFGGWLLAISILFAPFPGLGHSALAAQAAKPPGRANGDRQGSLIPRYNFPPASRGDRFAPRGLVLLEGIKGWARYGSVIKAVAKQEKVDPYVIGAYVWVESGFDPHQDYANNDHLAIGLGSVQPADYHWKYTERQLMDPWLNVTLTAREFKAAWHPHDMAGTVMDVWYPLWRKRAAMGQRIPVVHYPEVYVQAIANRYYALQDIDRHLVLRDLPLPKPAPVAKPKPQSRPKLQATSIVPPRAVVAPKSGNAPKLVSPKTLLAPKTPAVPKAPTVPHLPSVPDPSFAPRVPGIPKSVGLPKVLLVPKINLAPKAPVLTPPIDVPARQKLPEDEPLRAPEPEQTVGAA